MSTIISPSNSPTPPSTHFGQDERLGKLLAIIEELRANEIQEIQCPGVLVIGSQSAGKSSLMERLTGISFPRGDGICTRAPIIVQVLKHRAPRRRLLASTNPSFQNAEDYKEYNSMEELGSGIYGMLNHGSKVTISTDPVHVRIYCEEESNNHVLTLIDLPGMTEIDTRGGAPELTISDITEKLVRKYIEKNENMIMLAVIPAAEEFLNSKALRLAMQYDREGERIIGVATKIDLLPIEGDFEDKICMRRANDVKLKMGFFAVRNRKLSESNVDIDRIEADLYSKHQQLRSLHHEIFGFAALREKIYQIQKAYVDRFLPRVEQDVYARLMSIDSELGKLQAVSEEAGERAGVLAKVLREIDKGIDDLTVANEICQEEDSPVNICYWKKKLALNFKNELRTSVADMNVLGDEATKITKAIMEQTVGKSLANLPGDIAAKILVKKLFFQDVLKKTIYHLIEKTKENMRCVFQHFIGSKAELAPFPRLRNFLLECASECLSSEATKAEAMTTAIHDAESDWLNTSDEGYLQEIGAVVIEARGRASNQLRKLFPAYPKKGSEQPFDEDTNDMEANEAPKFSMYNGSAKSSIEYWKNNRLTEYAVPLEEFKKKYTNAIVQDGREGGSRMNGNLIEQQLSAFLYAHIIIRRLGDVIPMLVHSLMVRGVNRMFHDIAMRKYIETQNEGKDLFVESRDVEEKRKTLQERRNHLRSLKDRLTELNER